MKKKYFYIRDELYPIVEKSLKDKKNERMITDAINRFIDKNSDYLSQIGPTYLIVMGDSDKEKIYEAVNLDIKTIKTVREKSPAIKKESFIMANPFYIVLALLMHHYTIYPNREMRNLVSFTLAFAIYPLRHKLYYKYGVQENIMNYTINNLSNKYKIKQKGNLMIALTETAHGAYELYEEDFKTFDDDTIVQYILSAYTRINSVLKKISNQYYENHKKGNYLNTEYDDANPDNYRESSSSIQDVERLVNKVAMSLTIDGPPSKLIKTAANMNKVSVNELRNYLTVLTTDKNIDDIKKLLESIIHLFIFDETEHNSIEEINSVKFLVKSLDVYKRSNSKDEYVLRIKQILDKWMDDIDIYKKTQRVATINNFRKAIYTFFTLSIQLLHSR